MTPDDLLIEASRLEARLGTSHPDVIGYWSVAADAWEEKGDWRQARELRRRHVWPYEEQAGFKALYGISPPHGIFTKGTTMAYIKAQSRASGSPCFARETVRFFGGGRNYGPYLGPGGVYFVQVNRAGISIKEVLPDWSIHTVGRCLAGGGLDGMREEARLLAQGRGVGSEWDRHNMRRRR